MVMMWFQPGGGGANRAGIGDGGAVIGVWGGEVRQGVHDGGRGESGISTPLQRKSTAWALWVGYGLGKVPSDAPLDMDWAEDLVISHVSCTN